MDITYQYFDGRFYPSDVNYKTIPDGAIDVPADEFIKAMNRPYGYDFSVEANGAVTLIESIISAEELQLQFEAQRALLRQQADREIAWRQDAVDEGIATDAEKADLAECRKYRILLMRVNAPKANFPALPKAMNYIY